ncbi:ABC transporter ATP-binding protein [Bacillus shivajii]|uniref:ABC transporter ATP-binding protein n=1 Tax=Bacillus shivajii TaxID=1983719 RepID=UPI001CF97E58|nr:ABC transporter ATP-binding protein [Bacillus shivajii]UCZ53820.1 ABC transporter ATP-binding protein [Bacillus shivajii]
MSEYALSVKELTKKVKGNKRIVDNATFQVKKGEIMGLLGPNGAGKTTTIRMIVGLISKNEGTVLINGKDMDQDGQMIKSEVGAIVENPAFYDHMSGYKNLLQYARMARVPIEKDRIDEVVKLVKLDHAINDKVKKYSLGMKQRLGVAQAILHKPTLLILDEPTNGLDPQGIRELRDYLKVLASEGTSTLVSSHLLSEMQLMCDRVTIMEKGKIIDISELSSLDQSNEKSLNPVSFTVSDIEMAKQKAEQVQYEVVKASERIITFNLLNDDIPKVNRMFVKAGIDVYAIESAKTSLEDKFIELTSVAANQTDKGTVANNDTAN